MNKDYYFQHDYNPTNDPKMQAMLSVYGDWGYGLFWRMIEMLHREGEHAILMKRYVFTSFAQHKSTSVEQVEAFVKDCISEFELFNSDGSRFWSERVNRNIGKRTEISENRSKAGRASAEAKKAAALAQQNSTGVQQVSTGVQHNPTKEIKEKESKENKGGADAPALPSANVSLSGDGLHPIALSPNRPKDAPTVEQAKYYFEHNLNAPTRMRKFFEHYESSGWVDGAGRQMALHWQSKASKWVSDDIAKEQIAATKADEAARKQAEKNKPKTIASSGITPEDIRRQRYPERFQQ